MKVSIGTVIESEFGRGEVVAITDEWIIHRRDDGHEVALHRENSSFWIPVTEYGENGSLHETMEQIDKAEEQK